MDISDGRLADRAAVIVEAVVLDRGVAPAADRVATDHMVRVERVLKGSVPGSVIVVRTPGGVSPDGLELWVWGAPRLARGERVVLFLEPTVEGVYRFVELALGVFLQASVGGQEFLLQDLGELRRLTAERVARETPGVLPESARHRERFTSWLSARAQGRRRPADYFVSPEPAVGRGLEVFLQQRHSRRTGPVATEPGEAASSWYLEQTGNWRPAVVASLRRAMASREPDPLPPMRLLGEVAAAAGFARFDEVNTVFLREPLVTSDSASSRDCPPAGLVSVSGTWFRPGVVSQGRMRSEVLGGDVLLLLDDHCRGAMTADLPSLFEYELLSGLGVVAGYGDDSASASTQGVSARAVTSGPTPSAEFLPTDLDNLELYLISTDFGPDPIATCNTQACWNSNDENGDITEMYCDTAQGGVTGDTGYAPEGCVRWWEDQSSFDCGSCGTGAVADEWVTGHRHGQDDPSKPAYVSNCVNGQPCAALPTISEMGPNSNNQPACWELEFNDMITVTGDLSIFFLVKPEDQAGDWWYYGVSNNGLLHNVADDSLSFKAGGGSTRTITTGGAVDVSGGSWQLIEVHRAANGDYTVYVNETDVTAAGPPNETRDYQHRYLGAQNCNQPHVGMVGQVAAFLLYSDKLTLQERDDVRAYLDSVYDYSGAGGGPPPSGPQPRGYQARACGFDMDDDLVYGEPGDDCNVCDGVTTDVDGDGQDEDLIYVDCDAGVDQAACGTAGSPCASLDYALNTVADGPATGQEDIVCFRGTCSQENDTLIALSGKAGTKLRAKGGSEARDFEYPRDPAMIVGWDHDDDGEYPPYDPDDTAILYGGSPQCYSRVFRMSQSQPISFLELGHFTARQYGTCESGEDGGFIFHRGDGGSTNTHHYFHDLVMDDLNRGRYGYGGRNMFNLFVAGSRLQWFAWENIDIRNAGGHNARGESVASPGAADSGPLRFEKVSRTCLSGEPSATGGGQCIGYKLWGYFSGVEVIDNVFDLQPEAFQVRNNQANYFAASNICSQDFVFRNNLTIDLKTSFSAKGYGEGFSSCDAPDTARPVDDLLIDRNVWVNEYDWGSQGWDSSVFLSLDGCESVVSTIADVQVTNNFIYNEFGGEKVVEIDCAVNGAGPNPGQFVFANNTVHVPAEPPFGVIEQLCDDCSSPPCAYVENILFKNNIVDAPSGTAAMRFTCAPGGLVNDHNVYSPGTTFVWGGSSRSWSQWQADTQGDGNSKRCGAAFVNSASGDLHLASSDTCAVDSGEVLSSLTTVDIDGELRGAGSGWDVGADERDAGSSGYLLSIAKSGSGCGDVSSSPGGIDCGNDCEETYNSGTVVLLTPVGCSTSDFTGWSGDPDCSDGQVVMNGDRNCTASFDLGPELQVSKAGAGSGMVTSAPNGIACGGDCVENYSSGTGVELAAVPDLGFEFGGWSGNADCSDGVVGMQSSLVCTASFDVCSLPSDVQLDPPAQPINTVELYEACNILRGGTGGFPIVAPGDVTFRAGNRIELQEGFSIGSGAAFKALIGPSP